MAYGSLLLSVHPHMHYRGRDFKYVAYYPDGTNETLIHVDRFDFAWQTIYFYKEPKFVPAGTRIESTAIYDNSETAKAIWPAINIDRAITFGPASTDEMMIPYISWSHVNAEDDEEYRAERLAARLEREQRRAEFRASQAAEEEQALTTEEPEQEAALQ